MFWASFVSVIVIIIIDYLIKLFRNSQLNEGCVNFRLWCQSSYSIISTSNSSVIFFVFGTDLSFEKYEYDVDSKVDVFING